MQLHLFDQLKVLYVDDEAENLQAFSYALIDQCDVLTYERPEEALRAIEEDPAIAVVVADIRMPEMDGFAFLHRAAAINPYTANLILTGHTDEALAIRAINSRLCVGYHKKDHAFSGDHLARIIREAALTYSERYGREIVTANATLIVKRLMRLRDRDGRDRAGNVELLARCLLPYLDIPQVDRDLLLLAAIYYDVGKLALPDDRFAADARRSADLRDHVACSGRILGGLRGLEKCMLGALDHHEHWDGTGWPAGKKGEQISLFGRVLAVLDAFDAAVTGAGSAGPLAPAAAAAWVASQAGTRFCPQVAAAFAQMWREQPQVEDHYRAQTAVDDDGADGTDGARRPPARAAAPAEDAARPRATPVPAA